VDIWGGENGGIIVGVIGGGGKPYHVDPDGKGNGPGSEGPAGKTDHQQLRANFKNFLQNMSDSCKAALKDYISKLSNLANTVSFYDVDNIENKDYDKWFGVSDHKGQTVGAVFDAIGNVAEVFRNTQHAGIYTRGDASDVFGTNLYFLLHEMMENAVKVKPNEDSDQAVAGALGISQESSKSWAQTVSDWFNNKCSSSP
jgi:hypothetical protein